MTEVGGMLPDERAFERQLLRDVAANFVAEKAGTSFTRRMATSEVGVDEHLWREMAEMVWQGILVPENYGGMGLTLAEMSTVLQELGRAAYQGPFFTTAVSSVLAINQCDNENRKQELLSGIIKGNLIVSLALDEGYEYKWQEFVSTAVRNGRKFQLNGRKLFVPYAHVAGMLIVAAQCADGVGIFAVDRSLAGVEVAVLPVMSGEKLCSVQFDDVSLPEDCLLNAPEYGSASVEAMFHQCALLKCAEMVGGAAAALKMAVEHVSQRKQFDVPVGMFQAVQHRCADMLTLVDSASILVNESIDAVLNGDQSLNESASICKIWVSDAYRNTMRHAHQLMAGTGYMEETDLQLYFRHAKVCELAFGTPEFYRSYLAKCLAVAGGP